MVETGSSDFKCVALSQSSSLCENKHLTVEQVMAEFDISRATVFRNYAKIKKITGAVYDKNESVWKL